MAKKDQKGPSKVDDADEHDDAEHAEEEGADAAPARPVSAQERRARMRDARKEGGRRPVTPSAARGHDGDGHDAHGHGHDHHEDGDDIDTSNDPSWWVPHAVLGTLVVVGILGFFGVFNAIAARAGYKGVAGLVTETAQTSKPTEQKAPEPKPSVAPLPPQRPDQPPKEMFGAKHLLVMYKGSMRAPEAITRTKEEAKARAEDARKKAKAGSKFEDLVGEYSDEPGAGQRGGDLGKFPKGRMVPAFQDGLEKTKVGEVSDLVETPFGFHVILRTQ